jgi:dolichyl-phosphate-mannose--protein O-mannosyl transferase
VNSFGGFASKYIKGRFFMDVHPPLAKLLITLAGWLAGFDGNFDFKDIGKDYLEPGVPYVAMRLLPAVLGVLTVPLMFLTLKASGCRTITAVLGAGVVIFGKMILIYIYMYIYLTKLCSLTICRKWANHSIPSNPIGLAVDLLHSAHGAGVY